MVRRLAGADSEIGVAMAQSPRPHRIPIRLGHALLLHVKCAHVDRVGRGIGHPIERIAHSERPCGDEREVSLLRQQCASLEPELHLGGQLVVPIHPRVPGDAEVAAGGDIWADRAGDRRDRNRPGGAAIGGDFQGDGHRLGGAGEVVIDIDQLGAGALGGAEVFSEGTV